MERRKRRRHIYLFEERSRHKPSKASLCSRLRFVVLQTDREERNVVENEREDSLSRPGSKCKKEGPVAERSRTGWQIGGGNRIEEKKRKSGRRWSPKERKALEHQLATLLYRRRIQHIVLQKGRAAGGYGGENIADLREGRTNSASLLYHG